MKLRESILGVTRELEGAGVESASPEAELLVASVSGLLEASRADLYRSEERELSTAETRTLANLVLRRCAGEPTQYLIGRAWFRDLVLEVGPGVLIPRPETEVLAGKVLEWIEQRQAGSQLVRVLDIGTGSGCIALSLASECQSAEVVAIDLSREALDFCFRNLARVARRAPRAASRVRLVAGDLFTALKSDRVFDIVVSNPPYVGCDDGPSLPREVRDHEPPVALYSGSSGNATLHAIIDEASGFLRAGGLLALEVGEGHADNVVGRIAATGVFAPAEAVKDLAGRIRIVLAERSP